MLNFLDSLINVYDEKPYGDKLCDEKPYGDKLCDEIYDEIYGEIYGEKPCDEIYDEMCCDVCHQKHRSHSVLFGLHVLQISFGD